jgi:hypothetical protein
MITMENGIWIQAYICDSPKQNMTSVFEIKNKLTFVLSDEAYIVWTNETAPSHGFGDENQDPAHQVHVPQRPHDGVRFRQRL